jgi:hypothetical protein
MARVIFHLPEAFAGIDDGRALDLLRRYYGPGFGEPGFYTGSLFDVWDSTGTRAQDVDRFTADDLVAVGLLSVDVDPRAAIQLLSTRAGEFAALLAAVGPDRDLADENAVHDQDWVGWRLQQELQDLPGTGPTTASKLFARKRPRLRPIWDSVVAQVTGGRERLWAPLQTALSAEDRTLHRRLQDLRAAAGLPPQVSVLRVFDVIAWMEGKSRGL